MARQPNEKAAEAEVMYRKGKKLIDIAKKLDVPPGTVRRWKSTYHWDAGSKKKQNERSDNENERSQIPSKLKRGGQKGNTNALKNATYATEYWKDVTNEELAMMNDMPIDEEFQLIETLRLAVLREKRYMGLLARYRELLNNSPDGLILREDIKTVIKYQGVKGIYTRQEASAQQTKVDGVEQMQIIEAELTRVQKVKIKTIEALSKIRHNNSIGDDSETETVDDWIAGVMESEDG